MTKATKPARKTKSDTVKRMLSRKNGATIAEIEKATGWKPHSCRAFLSGVRKSEAELIKEERENGNTAYRLVSEVKR